MKLTRILLLGAVPDGVEVVCVEAVLLVGVAGLQDINAEPGCSALAAISSMLVVEL